MSVRGSEDAEPSMNEIQRTHAAYPVDRLGGGDREGGTETQS